MPLSAASTRYSLVKGERIVRSVLTTRLRDQNVQKNNTYIELQEGGDVLTFSMWYYILLPFEADILSSYGCFIFKSFNFVLIPYGESIVGPWLDSLLQHLEGDHLGNVSENIGRNNPSRNRLS